MRELQSKKFSKKLNFGTLNFFEKTMQNVSN